MKFIMMVGLPGSGKSYKANLLADEFNANIHSSDSIRKELFGSEDVQDQNQIVFATLHSRIMNDMKVSKSVVYDATNLSAKQRIHMTSMLDKYDVEKICVVVARPFDECLKFDSIRDRNVGEKVLSRMYMRWTTPTYGEGWDKIEIYYPNDDYQGCFGNYKLACENLVDYNQNNHFHTLSLGNHIKAVAEYVSLHNPISENVVIAAYLHDIGKPFTRTDDEKTGESHYFQHAGASGYDVFFYSGIQDVLSVSALVNYHMHVYNWDEKNFEKMKKKYSKILGYQLFEELMQLHNGDINGH